MGCEDTFLLFDTAERYRLGFTGCPLSTYMVHLWLDSALTHTDRHTPSTQDTNAAHSDEMPWTTRVFGSPQQISTATLR